MKETFSSKSSKQKGPESDILLNTTNSNSNSSNTILFGSSKLLISPINTVSTVKSDVFVFKSKPSSSSSARKVSKENQINSTSRKNTQNNSRLNTSHRLEGINTNTNFLTEKRNLEKTPTTSSREKLNKTLHVSAYLNTICNSNKVNKYDDDITITTSPVNKMPSINPVNTIHSLNNSFINFNSPPKKKSDKTATG